MSDDPLSNCIFMILDNMSGQENGCGRRCVCAYTAHSGLLYIGDTDSSMS